jgi:para-aminobenzoate synthetase component 1
MLRNYRDFPAGNIPDTKLNLLNWASRFNIFVFLDNHRYNLPLHSCECLVAAGEFKRFSLATGTSLDSLDAFLEAQDDWIFGHLAYDLKDRLEALESRHPDHIGFGELCFFVPRMVCMLVGDNLRIGTVDEDPDKIYRDICAAGPGFDLPAALPMEIRQRLSREEYLDAIAHLQAHIRRGDCYEINYCMEFYADQVRIDPLAVYRGLARHSPNPFSACYRNGDQYLLCASPERYLRREGQRLISQPIKGTARRLPDRPFEDKAQAERLQQSAKERSENVMVVDLVRNDLSRVCVEGSVQVDELFGIYSFPQVFQMISTVSGLQRPGTRFTDILRATFPMGSMTGAPKRRVMELAEQYERSRRGLFSGALGYFSPEGDFDFNVVIRSILYNAHTGYLSFPAGSAITHYADAKQEYEECLLKASAIRQVLGA